MADVIRIRKEVYDPRYAEWRREIESLDVQVVATEGEVNVGTGADYDLLTYTVPAGKDAILWAVTASGTLGYVAVTKVGATPVMNLKGLANQFMMLWGTKSEPIYVAPSGSVVKLVLKSAPLANYTGSLHFVLIPTIRSSETD